MTIDEFYSIVKVILNKNQQGYLSPEKFNLLANAAQDEWVAYLSGEFQQYQNGRSQPRISYSQNSTIRNRLTPVIYGYTLNIDSTGFAPYMGDYLQVDTMWTIYGSNRVRQVDQPRLYSFINSRIDPIATNPIYLLEDRGFRFYPNSLVQAKVEYVRNPPRVEWAYNLDSDARPIYDAVNSIDFVFYDTDLFEIMARLLRVMGVSLQANEVSQYASEIKMQGQ